MQRGDMEKGLQTKASEEFKGALGKVKMVYQPPEVFK